MADTDLEQTIKNSMERSQEINSDMQHKRLGKKKKKKKKKKGAYLSSNTYYLGQMTLHFTSCFVCKTFAIGKFTFWRSLWRDPPIRRSAGHT